MNSRIKTPHNFSYVKLAARNFAYRVKSNVLFCAGCALSAAVLTGALLVGNSLDASLRDLHNARLGEVTWTITSPNNNFRASLADSIQKYLRVTAAPILPLTGSVGVAGGNTRVHRVNILGVDGRFWDLCNDETHDLNFCSSLASNKNNDFTVVNNTLARALNIKVGDDIILRFQNANSLAMEAPFGTRENFITRRATVTHIADSDNFGDFNLRAEHFFINNVFVPLEFLREASGVSDVDIIFDTDATSGADGFDDFGQTDHAHLVNTILIGGSSSITDSMIADVMQKSIRAKDAGINLRAVGDDNNIEIYGGRIFIGDNIRDMIVNAIPNAIPVSSWFVNSINNLRNDLSTPYSFAATPPVNYPLDDDGIILNRWTADDLDAKIGDTITLIYFVPQQTSGLRIDTSAFIVSQIVETARPPFDSTLMPPYPGLSGAESCTDWDPSIPVDLSRIRPKDELYWELYEGAPKAVITYSRAAQIWANRFGVTTAIRVSNNNARSVERAITNMLTPASCGMRITNVRADIDRAISGGIDYAPLFLGLSFFTLASALLFIALLSSLQMKSRADEQKILTALGYSRSRVIQIYLAESFLCVLIGTLFGVIIGIFYTLTLIHGLRTVWSAAALMPNIRLSVDTSSLIIGFAASSLCALVSMLIPMLSQTSKPKIQKLPPRKKLSADHHMRKKIFGIRCLIIRSIKHEKIRALTVAATLASAVLILGITQLFRHTPLENPRLRESGTGGFYWYGESDFAISREHTTAAFLRERGIDIDDGDFISVPMRKKDGDDASCLNLNQAATPPLLGVDQNIFDSLQSFTFAANINNINKKRPWQILGSGAGENVIYGIADANTIEWGLGKSVGDTLVFINERGDIFYIVLAAAIRNSILQGGVIIAESDFINHFPSISGYRVILAAPPVGLEQNIARAFETYHDLSGLYFVSTVDRLNNFNAVENTYLSIFALLGMIGLTFGCASLWIVVARDIVVRRYEFAMLRALGYSANMIRLLLFAEHAAVVAAGLLAGLIPAVVIYAVI